MCIVQHSARLPAVTEPHWLQNVSTTLKEPMELKGGGGRERTIVAKILIGSMPKDISHEAFSHHFDASCIAPVLVSTVGGESTQSCAHSSAKGEVGVCSTLQQTLNHLQHAAKGEDKACAL